MKKVLNYLKVLIIVLLIAGAIGGTAYFFFTHLKTKPDAFGDTQNYIYGGEKSVFNSQIGTISEKASVAGNNNLKLLVTTNEKLDEFALSLSSYLIVADNYNINQEAIVNSLNNLKNEQSNTSVIMNNYIEKTLGPSFNHALGANPVYSSFSKYLLAYSNFISTINGELNKMNINKESDAKFCIIDLYLRIVNNTFNEKNIAEIFGYVQVKDSSNLVALQGADGTRLQLQNSFIKSNEAFTGVVNEFTKNYNLCNKDNFAKDFNTITTAVKDKELTADVTDYSERAAICLNKILGV